VLTSTIPSSTTLVPGSAWASQGTVAGTGPVVFHVGNVAPNVQVTLTLAVTVSAQIIEPTVLSRMVTMQWSDGSLVREQTIIANPELAYLPIISRQYDDGH